MTGRGRDDQVVIATIGRPHGVHGELRAYPTGPTLAALHPGDRVTVRGDAGERILTLRGIRDGSSHLLIAFDGLTDREAAASVVGGALLVVADRLADLEDEDEYYVRDLIGSAVVDEDGRHIGVVGEVHDGAANPSLEVALDDGDVLLIPFTHDAIVAVQASDRRIVLRRGLLGGGDA